MAMGIPRSLCNIVPVCVLSSSALMFMCFFLVCVLRIAKAKELTFVLASVWFGKEIEAPMGAGSLLRVIVLQLQKSTIRLGFWGRL